MPDYEKIGLLVLNSDDTKFMVCQKYKRYVTDSYIMPGGRFEEGSVEECLKNEIKEELGCSVDLSTLRYIGTYRDAAAGKAGQKVVIRLYKGELIGQPEPRTEIESLHWIGREAVSHPKTSPIIKNKIIPDLIKKGILK